MKTTPLFLLPYLQRNENFCEAVLPRFSPDEFRMTRGTMEVLCRELAATGRVPQGHILGRTPIPLHKQVASFVWYMQLLKIISHFELLSVQVWALRADLEAFGCDNKLVNKIR